MSMLWAIGQILFISSFDHSENWSDSFVKEPSEGAVVLAHAAADPRLSSSIVLGPASSRFVTPTIIPVLSVDKVAPRWLGSKIICHSFVLEEETVIAEGTCD